jgi:hypothetical protein
VRLITFTLIISLLAVLISMSGCATTKTVLVKGGPITCYIKTNEGVLAVLNFDNTTYDQAMADTQTVIDKLTLDGLLNQDATGSCKQ